MPDSLLKAKSRSETEIQRQILLACNRLPGVQLWRINSGALPNASGRPIRFGAKGMSDIIGWRQRRVVDHTDPMVTMGLRMVTMALRIVLAQFVALEVKRPGQKPTVEQAAFLTAVNAAGGIGRVVYSAADAVAALQE